MLFGLFLLVLAPALVGAAAPSFVGPALLAQHAEAGTPVDFSVFPRHPPAFRIEDRFTANITISGAPKHDVGLHFNETNGTFIYDAIARVNVQTAEVVLRPFNNYTLRQKRITLDDAVILTWEEACLNFTINGTGFMSVLEIFALVGNYSGKSVVRGRQCDVYTITGAPPLRINMSLCVAEKKWPLELNTSYQRVVFENFSTKVDPAQLAVPEVCKHIPPSCGDGALVKETIYVAHPKNNYNISDQDVADAKGDAAFLCFDTGMASAGGYQLLSAFELTMVRNFTQYANYPPPGGKGFGGDLFHVGRETPLGIGKHWGQCDDDVHYRDQFGTWLSLPGAGQCVHTSQTIGKDCTWRIERRVATIELSCLQHEKGLLNQCASAVGPFTEITDTLLKAMSDPAQGGCPQVADAECAVHPRCAHLQGDCCPHEDGMMLECCKNQTLDFTHISI